MKITAREALVAGADLTTTEIANLLGLTRATVRAHMAEIEAQPTGKQGHASTWGRGDYLRAFPRLAVVAGGPE